MITPFSTNVQKKAFASLGSKPVPAESVVADQASVGAIRTAFGALIPRPVKATSSESRDVSKGLPIAGNEIHSSNSSKLNFVLAADSSADAAIELAKQATDLRAGALTLPVANISAVREQIGENSILRLQTLTGNSTAQVSAAVAQGADEIAVQGFDFAGLGSSSSAVQELKDLIAAADGRLLKLEVDPASLSSAQLLESAQAAQDAGLRFLRVKGAPESALGLAGQVKIGLEFSEGVSSAAEIGTLSQSFKGHRLRFESSNASAIVEQEYATLQSSRSHDQAGLDSDMATPDGQLALGEREKLKAYFGDKIAKAHSEGKPIVYLSVPVRGNDAGTFEENIAAHHSLVESANASGLAFVDPFEVEGTPILTSLKISHRAIQELLMDPMTGMWPEVLGKCDAIAHVPNWKYSTGAKEEQLMADSLGIPNWDLKSVVELKRNQAHEGCFIVE